MFKEYQKVKSIDNYNKFFFNLKDENKISKEKVFYF